MGLGGNHKQRFKIDSIPVGLQLIPTGMECCLCVRKDTKGLVDRRAPSFLFFYDRGQ